MVVLHGVAIELTGRADDTPIVSPRKASYVLAMGQTTRQAYRARTLKVLGRGLSVDYANLPGLLPSRARRLLEWAIEYSRSEIETYRWEVWDTSMGNAAVLVHAFGYYLITVPATAKQLRFCQWSPGSRSVLNEDSVETEWGHGHLVRKWARCVQREMDALGWFEGNLLSQVAEPVPQAQDEQAPFSDSEKREMRKRLDALERELLNRPISTAQQAEIREGFRDLSDKLDSLTRGSWRKLLLGQLMLFALNQILTLPEVAAALNQLTHLVRNMIGHIG